MSVSVCQGTKEASPLITVRLNGHFRCEASNIIDVVDAQYICVRICNICEYNIAYHLKFNVVCMNM